MPVIDLPLAELRKYRGINPRPSDFEAYWRQALRDLDETPPKPKLIPQPKFSNGFVEAFDLWFTGIGGAQIHAKYLRPARSGAKRNPTLLQFHGYSMNSGDWTDKFGWVAGGFCVAALDCRGQGGLSEDRGGVLGNTLSGQIIRGLDDPDPTKLLFRSIFLDTVQLARAVTTFPEVDEHRLGATGQSQGGALTLACAALEPRIKRIAPVYPFLCDYQRVWEMDLAKDAYEELRTFFRRRDPTHAREKEVFTKLGYIDCQHLASRIKAEVLMFTGLSDPICPPSSQFAAYNKIRAKKAMVLYPDYGHEWLPEYSDRVWQFMAGL
jgi:cephalosporin-C deacetylase